MKPSKWSGFQAGNRQVVELFALHAGGCQLVLVTHNGPTDAPWLDPISGAPRSDGIWRQDLRSYRLWRSPHPVPAPWRTFWVCAQCQARLRSELDPAAPEPLVVSPGLWFCGGACLDSFCTDPSLVWEPMPAMPSTTRLELRCLRCEQNISFGSIDTPDAGAEDVADWLTEHVYEAAEGAGLEAPGCHLGSRLVWAANTDR
jgi:hypothetical protein